MFPALSPAREFSKITERSTICSPPARLKDFLHSNILLFYSVSNFEKCRVFNMEKSVNRAGSACHRKQTIVRFFFRGKKNPLAKLLLHTCSLGRLSLMSQCLSLTTLSPSSCPIRHLFFCPYSKKRHEAKSPPSRRRGVNARGGGDPLLRRPWATAGDCAASWQKGQSLGGPAQGEDGRGAGGGGGEGIPRVKV